MATTFFIPRKEQVLRGQKRYNPIPCYSSIDSCKKIKILKKDLSKCRKTSIDMRPFG